MFYLLLKVLSPTEYFSWHEYGITHYLKDFNEIQIVRCFRLLRGRGSLAVTKSIWRLWLSTSVHCRTGGQMNSFTRMRIVFPIKVILNVMPCCCIWEFFFLCALKWRNGTRHCHQRMFRPVACTYLRASLRLGDVVDAFGDACFLMSPSGRRVVSNSTAVSSCHFRFRRQSGL